MNHIALNTSDFTNCWFPYPWPTAGTIQSFSFVWPPDNTERVKALEDELATMQEDMKALRARLRRLERGQTNGR